MIKRNIIISLISLFCFMQVQAKDISFKAFNEDDFKAQLNRLKQETQAKYWAANQGIDAQINTLLNSFDLKMYKSIKSDTVVPQLTEGKYSLLRSSRRKRETTKYYWNLMKANQEISQKQEYFHKTAAILNYLKRYDRKMPFNTKKELLSALNKVVQKGKENDFKEAYRLAKGLSKNFFKYVRVS